MDTAFNGQANLLLLVKQGRQHLKFYYVCSRKVTWAR
jgi:hypothetical protein